MNKSVTAGSKIITIYNETYAGNKTITSYNLENIQMKKFDEVQDNIFNFKIKITQRTSWLSPMMHVIVSIGIGAAIGYGSHLIITKTITSGNFVSFITALIMLYTPIKNLGNNLNDVQFSFMAIDRIFGMLNRKPQILDNPNCIKMQGLNESIEYKNVFFRYSPKLPDVLENINFKVKAGTTTAFVGNSGGGKTTLVNLLPRFYNLESGEILFDGVNIKNFELASLRANIAVVFQDNFLFSGTIKENILLGKPDATEDEIKLSVKMACLEEFVTSLEKGLNTEIGERGIRLSGGQKQRIAIARAFLKNAPIVVLDEATSALDNKAEAVVQKAIDNLMKDKTVFVIAHRLSTIKNADKIIVVNKAHIVEEGTHEELLKLKTGHIKVYTKHNLDSRI